MVENDYEPGSLRSIDRRGPEGGAVSLVGHDAARLLAEAFGRQGWEVTLEAASEERRWVIRWSPREDDDAV